MQIAPLSGKLVGTNIGTPVYVFDVSLYEPKSYGNRASVYGTEGIFGTLPNAVADHGRRISTCNAPVSPWTFSLYMGYAVPGNTWLVPGVSARR
jgi:hypothetical protein